MSEYNIQMNKYNALNAEYDQLYPVTKIEDVDGLDTSLQNKADASSVYTKEESISAETRTALSLTDTATPDDAFSEIARKLPEIGSVSMKLLWENASPNSAFAEQTVSLDLSKYQKVGIIVLANNQGDVWNNGEMGLKVFRKSGSVSRRFIEVVTNDGYGVYFAMRTIVISDTGIAFSSNSFSAMKVSSSSTDNNSNIPVAIYGIKEVI